MEFFIDFDNVKAEKLEAIRRFNQRQNINKLLLILSEVLLAFFLISWMSTRLPGALQTAGDLFREIVIVLKRPLFGFILFNVLVLVVFFLSGRKSNSTDIYDEYAGSTGTAAENTAVDAEESVVEKQIILEDNAVLKKETVKAKITEVSERVVSPSPVKEDGTSTITEPEGAFGAAKITEPKRAVSEVNKKAYQRSQSEMFENKIARVELRRSATTIHGEMLIAGVESPRKSMDELSSEEFRRTIESFIKEKKKTLIRENSTRFLD